MTAAPHREPLSTPYSTGPQILPIRVSKKGRQRARHLLFHLQVLGISNEKCQKVEKRDSFLELVGTGVLLDILDDILELLGAEDLREAYWMVPT